MHKQDRQHRTLPEAAQRNPAAGVVGDLERSEDP